MKKISLSILVISSFIFYSLLQRSNNQTTPSPLAAASDNSSRQNQPSVSTSPSNNSNSGAAASPNPSSGYKDGSFTGNAVDAFYGTVQVKAVIQNGKLTDVQFLQSPNDRPTSIFINGMADPILKNEAIQVQSAQVDTVTGATDSSQAFIESLQSALNQAKS